MKTKCKKVLLCVDPHKRQFDKKEYRINQFKEVTMGTVSKVLLEHFLPDSLKIEFEDGLVPIEITIKDLR